MSTTVDFSTERAARELGKAEPAGPAGLMKPPPQVPSLPAKWAQLCSLRPPPKVSAMADTES